MRAFVTIGACRRADPPNPAEPSANFTGCAAPAHGGCSACRNRNLVLDPSLSGVARPGILPSFSQSDRASSLHPIREGAHVVPARRFAAARAWLPVASACFAVIVAAPARAQTQVSNCEEAAEIAVLSSPLAPWKGAPLRV